MNVGQGRSAFAGAFGADRSGRSVYPRPRPDRVFACDAGAAPQQIKLQVGLANALYHTNGFATAETKAAFDEARSMIEQAETLGEHTEDPLLLYSVLYGFFIAKFIVFDGDAAWALARQFLAFAEQQNTTASIMIGHRLLATTLLCWATLPKAFHLDRALALYDPAAHRPLATRFGHDVGAATLTFRPLALWLLGYPKTAMMETDHAIEFSRETGHAPTLLFALTVARSLISAVDLMRQRSAT